MKKEWMLGKEQHKKKKFLQQINPRPIYLNPWIFKDLKSALKKKPLQFSANRDTLNYLGLLYPQITHPEHFK